VRDERSPARADQAVARQAAPGHGAVQGINLEGGAALALADRARQLAKNRVRAGGSFALTWEVKDVRHELVAIID
jgi:hypothetical protein